jgi:hypothetical protein
VQAWVKFLSQGMVYLSYGRCLILANSFLCFERCSRHQSSPSPPVFVPRPSPKSLLGPLDVFLVFIISFGEPLVLPGRFALLLDADSYSNEQSPSLSRRLITRSCFLRARHTLAQPTAPRAPRYRAGRRPAPARAVRAEDMLAAHRRRAHMPRPMLAMTFDCIDQHHHKKLV